MKTRSVDVQKRIEAFRNKIESVHVGDPIEFAALLQSLSGSLRDRTTERQLIHALRSLRRDIEGSDSSSSLEISKNSVRLSVKDETLFDQNMQRNLPQKRAIVSVLWHWLFDFPLTEGLGFAASWMGMPQRNDRIGKRIDTRRTVLRGRVNPALVVDAGSTNTIAIERFLRTATHVPFLITEHKKLVPAHEDVSDEDKKEDSKGKTKKEELIAYKRLIAPLFVTNSIVIADKIARSRFRHSILLRVIGGTDRPERRSICGELSLLWLRACDQDGKMIALDLAVIGSTGLETVRFDTPVLCCDSAEEASLKSRLLAMSKFRIVLLDSTKIVNGGGGSMFASVSEGDIDLIITDSGADKEAQHAVMRLSSMCDKNGVGLIIANLPELG